jgi:hypothetical protein
VDGQAEAPPEASEPSPLTNSFGCPGRSDLYLPELGYRPRPALPDHPRQPLQGRVLRGVDHDAPPPSLMTSDTWERLALRRTSNGMTVLPY